MGEGMNMQQVLDVGGIRVKQEPKPGVVVHICNPSILVLLFCFETVFRVLIPAFQKLRQEEFKASPGYLVKLCLLKNEVWGCSSVVDYLSSMCNALCSVLSIGLGWAWGRIKK